MNAVEISSENLLDECSILIHVYIDYHEYRNEQSVLILNIKFQQEQLIAVRKQLSTIDENRSIFSSISVA
jgi:hypothetical protein